MGYRELLRRPEMRRLAALSVVARLPTSMWAVVLFLLVTERRDASAAAVAVSAYTLGQAVTAPLRGRWVDRHGVRRVLPLTTLAYVGAVTAVVLTAGHVSLGLTDGLAVVAGATLPPVVATVRGLWLTLIPAGAGRQTALALDATLLEIAFVAGPATAGVVSAAASPAYGAVGMVVLLLVSVVAVLAMAPAGGAPRVPGSVWGPIASGGFVTVVLLALAPTTVVSGVEVLLLTISHTGGYAWAGGALLALMSAGSFVGGLAYGASGRGRPPERRFVSVLALMAAGLPLILLGRSAPWAFVALAPLLGATTAPAIAAVFGMSAESGGASTEAQSWVNSGLIGGFGLGALAVAPFTHHIGVAVLTLAVVAAGGAAATWWARGVLASPGSLAPAAAAEA